MGAVLPLGLWRQADLAGSPNGARGPRPGPGSDIHVPVSPGPRQRVRHASKGTTSTRGKDLGSGPVPDLCWANHSVCLRSQMQSLRPHPQCGGNSRSCSQVDGKQHEL